MKELGLILLGMLGVVLINYFTSKHNANQLRQEMVQYWEEVDFETDSQKVYIDYTKIPIEKFVNYVPPSVTVEYIDSTRTVNNQTYLVNTSDSLLTVIDSLSGVITNIESTFLTRFPEAPKLLQALISADTVALDLLNIDGSIRKNIYPVNYNRFSYQYIDGEFRARELSKITEDSGRRFNLNPHVFGYGGYEWLDGNFVGGIRTFIYPLPRWDLSANSLVIFNRNPSMIFTTTLGYKIWQKN